jgi:hypothetical protein
MALLQRELLSFHLLTVGSLGFCGRSCNGVDDYTLLFRIRNTWSINQKAKGLKVRLDPEWLTRIKQFNLFRMLDFDWTEVSWSLGDVHLYEILLKTFQGKAHGKWMA